MKKIVWALLDDRMGSIGQAKGVMQALDPNEFEIIEKKIVYTRLAKIPNFLKGKSLIGVSKKDSGDIYHDFPDLVLSISRRTAPIARWIKKKSKQKSKLVQLMRIEEFEAQDFDLIIVPEHDRKADNLPNVMRILGCPHRISEKNTLEAKKKWEAEFANLPKPLTAVVIGGSIKGKAFSDENAKKLGEDIKALKKKIGGSILITTSRRTGIDAEEIIMEELKGIPAHTFLWGEKKENPYMGYIACGEQIIITGDSVSMCCEACGTGNPVLIFTGENWLTPKHMRFVNSLYEKGFAVSINDKQALKFKPKGRLDPCIIIIEKIAALFR